MCGEQIVANADQSILLSVQPRVCGEQNGANRSGSFVPVQPRVCGEQMLSKMQPMPISGSAPRVRGTDDFRQKCVRHGRFSPACAGNRPGRHDRPASKRFSPACAGNRAVTYSHQSTATVQPRVCGEQSNQDRCRDAATTVQPRVCGEQARTMVSTASRRRFSPACAGNRLRGDLARSSMAVQPRVCGEQAVGHPSGRDHAVQPRVCGEQTCRATP